MGIAILDGTNIVHYGVKNLKKFRPQKVLQEAVKDILTRLVVEYGIKTFVVEDGHFSQIASSLYNTVLKSIRDTAKEKRLELKTYDPKTIRKFICGDGRATKKRTSQTLAKRYPELEIYLEQNYRWKEKYWMNAFDALAAGLTHVMVNQNAGYV